MLQACLSCHEYTHTNESICECGSTRLIVLEEPEEELEARLLKVLEANNVSPVTVV